MSAEAHSSDYYIPNPSPWPIIGMVSLLTTLIGTALAINGVGIGKFLVIGGLLLFAFLLYGWFRDVIGENLSDCYNKQVDTSFRMGMFWFIASEVFFFLSFFGALFYIRTIALPWLGGEGYLGTYQRIPLWWRLCTRLAVCWPGGSGRRIHRYGSLGYTGN